MNEYDFLGILDKSRWNSKKAILCGWQPESH